MKARLIDPYYTLEREKEGERERERGGGYKERQTDRQTDRHISQFSSSHLFEHREREDQFQSIS